MARSQYSTARPFQEDLVSIFLPTFQLNSLSALCPSDLDARPLFATLLHSKHLLRFPNLNFRRYALRCLSDAFTDFNRLHLSRSTRVCAI
jgi:hypothetical protein